MGLIACYYRAAEWEHTDVMVAPHNLLLYLDKTMGKTDCLHASRGVLRAATAGVDSSV